MPLYDYGCKQCDHEFEALQSMGEAPLTQCPQCGEAALQKKVAAPAFTFKGGGWYKDLYATAGGKTEKSSGETKSSEKSTPEKASGETTATKPSTEPSKPTSTAKAS